MTEDEFIQLNEQLRKRQAKIRKAREQAEPVHVSKVLPEVMNDILHRSDRQTEAMA